MRDKEKLYSTTLASIALFLFLILASPTASASTVQSDPLTIVETQITTHGTASNPDIYGSTIVWQDNRNGNGEIYSYNLNTLKNFGSRVRWHYSPPSIYGNRIVWLDSSSEGWEIYIMISQLPAKLK